MCSNHNCKQGRNCPKRTDDGFSEWLDSVGRFITVFAAACILGWLLGWVVAPLAVDAMTMDLFLGDVE